ncbi:MAG TPA: PIN domain protein [Bacteroidia bacterium]|jgi:hypothetical protein|nr:PIN domain protein [Bacteroidia bacterium]
MERIYLDTSVFGGYFEPEFELWTKILFDQIKKGKYKVLLSQIIDFELTNAPPYVKELVHSIPAEQIEYLITTDEAKQLADSYIKENVVGKTSEADCLHIALASLNYADILVSWNFKHIVNVNRIRGYNAVNYKFGHRMIEIRTPREILEI